MCLQKLDGFLKQCLSIIYGNDVNKLLNYYNEIAKIMIKKKDYPCSIRYSFFNFQPKTNNTFSY